jgi:hypothetical protein
MNIRHGRLIVNRLVEFILNSRRFPPLPAGRKAASQALSPHIFNVLA